MNYLGNGAVLPSGLLGHDSTADQAGFNKTYKNFALRMGVISAVYPISDKKNHSKLTTEYDVLVFEQQGDRGSSVVTYRNCMSAEGLGSIADFFEMTLRTRKKKSSSSVDTKDQNGAVVLILALDGMTEKGIIIGAITHPNRKSTLTSQDPHLEGEYNGVHIVVQADGSTTLTFKGATDNDGKIVDSSQGPTEIRIEKDGSYQVSHKTITQRLDKNGKASLTTDDDISNTTKTNFNVTAQKDVNVQAQGDFNLKSNNLVASAQGSASLECQSASIKAQSAISLSGSQFSVEAQAMASVKAPAITLDGNVALGGSGGQPVLIMSTIFMGLGNLGIPVISQAISGFATKVTAT